MHILKMKTKHYIGIVLLFVLLIVIVGFVYDSNLQRKNERGELTYSHLKINSLNTYIDNTCYNKNLDNCPAIGCEYCRDYGCSVLMNHEVGIALPNNVYHLECKKKVYVDGILSNEFSNNNYYSYDEPTIRNTDPWVIGDSSNRIKFEICCNNGDGKDVCVSQTQEPIC